MQQSSHASDRRGGFEKIVLVTRKTRLAELIERFNTLGQAKFYIEHAGGNFDEYVLEDEAYRRSAETVRREAELGLKVQEIDRGLVPTFLFLPQDIVITLGQDGLVANTAKYVGSQPIIPVNPDPARFDGILLPFLPNQVRQATEKLIERKSRIRRVTLAEARLSDGQRLLAFNDFFLGAQSHISARYRIKWGKDEALVGGHALNPIRLDWEDRRLLFVVREPFISRHSQASIVAGIVEPQQAVVLESLMPSGGVIFSDGIEADFLQFNSGTSVVVRAAESTAQLVVG